MPRNRFVLLPANGFIWNRDEFIRFLIANQGHSIVVDTHEQPEHVSNNIANELHTQLDLPMHMLTAEASEFFKHHYRSNWYNRGIMIREVDVIRAQGW